MKDPFNFVAPQKLLQKHSKLDRTVIKCKKCHNIFYESLSSTHTCFLDYTKKKKVLDPSKHCLVDGCRHALNCRYHTTDEKRKVSRPYSFDMLCKTSVEKKKKVHVCEVDEEIINIINGIQPVVNKMWHWPRYKYETLGMKNIFNGVLKKKKEGKREEKM